MGRRTSLGEWLFRKFCNIRKHCFIIKLTLVNFRDIVFICSLVNEILIKVRRWWAERLHNKEKNIRIYLCVWFAVWFRFLLYIILSLLGAAKNRVNLFLVLNTFNRILSIKTINLILYHLIEIKLRLRAHFIIIGALLLTCSFD